ncbi:MAG: cob(I)yrinic acid a,c-diamide adenosyltransferase [Candidatus Eisenbacteria bacterium]|nr:cob(I)yrinic acid a,c-diamide adenosyltransferase [Candidatus Eisenbacteria bacterium]MCC7144214.1 cob(I)yrinic acid a,c-diamide adenosyltransferase [Candidatus Eisenbacteria bacterium]
MKIYTKQGDGGETGLLGGGRVAKSEPRIHAIGALDELNAALGMVLATPELVDELRSTLLRVQNGLFEVGAALASPDPEANRETFPGETAWLEQIIDATEALLPPLDRFILPGGQSAGAGIHWARTLCRRAEREVVGAVGREPGRANLLAYLNRLSDALFVLARRANQLDGAAETPWLRLGGSGTGR